MDIFSLIKDIQKQPALYLGHSSLNRLAGFVEGYLCAQGNIMEKTFFQNFQSWTQSYYHLDHLEKKYHWSDVIGFFCLDDRNAFERFYSLLEKYSQDR